MEIGTYLERNLDTELSGNVADLCPVGALLPKPGAFSYRPWELIKFESIDVLNAMGSNIRVDARGLEVKRIIPSTSTRNGSMTSRDSLLMVSKRRD